MLLCIYFTYSFNIRYLKVFINVFQIQLFAKITQWKHKSASIAQRAACD